VIWFYIRTVRCLSETFEFKDVLYRPRSPQLKFERFWSSIELTTGCLAAARWSDYWSGPCRLGPHSMHLVSMKLGEHTPQRYSLILKISHLRLNTLLLHEKSNSHRMISTSFEMGAARWMQSAPKCSRKPGEVRQLTCQSVLYVQCHEIFIFCCIKLRATGRVETWFSQTSYLAPNCYHKMRFRKRWVLGPDPSRFEWETIQTLWLLKNRFDRGCPNNLNCNNTNRPISSGFRRYW
jgi:hypothetical protein